MFVEEYTGIHSWVEDLTRYTVVHSREVVVLFVDTRPVDAIAFHHGLLGADDPASFSGFRGNQELPMLIRLLIRGAFFE
jgi:hypothetical protein